MTHENPEDSIGKAMFTFGNAAKTNGISSHGLYLLAV
jgi:hypothetical protein